MSLIQTAPKIKTLDFSDNQLTDDSVDFLTSFCEKIQDFPLNNLDLSKNNITTKGIVRLLKADMSKKVDISENKIGLHALSQVADASGDMGGSYRNLQELNLSK